MRTLKLQSWLFASQYYCYWRKRAQSTMEQNKEKELRRIDRCECIPGTFVSILHFPSTGRKQWERRGEKKKRKLGSFLLNSTQREDSLIIRFGFLCPGKSTLNRSDDEWANTWNTGLIVVKNDIRTKKWAQMWKWMLSFYFSFCESQNGCIGLKEGEREPFFRERWRLN